MKHLLKLFKPVFIVAISCIMCHAFVACAQEKLDFDRNFPNPNGPLRPFEAELLPAESITRGFVEVRYADAGSVVYQDRRYVQSKANAKSKAYDEMDTVIDVYLIDSGHYLYSFYLPRYKREPVMAFVVENNYIIALQGNYQVKYLLKNSLAPVK